MFNKKILMLFTMSIDIRANSKSSTIPANRSTKTTLEEKLEQLEKKLERTKGMIFIVLFSLCLVLSALVGCIIAMIDNNEEKIKIIEKWIKHKEEYEKQKIEYAELRKQREQKEREEEARKNKIDESLLDLLRQKDENLVGDALEKRDILGWFIEKNPQHRLEYIRIFNEDEILLREELQNLFIAKRRDILSKLFTKEEQSRLISPCSDFYNNK